MFTSAVFPPFQKEKKPTESEMKIYHCFGASWLIHDLCNVCVCVLCCLLFLFAIYSLFSLRKKFRLFFFCVGLLKTIILPADTIPCSDKSFSPLACRSVEFKSCNNEANEKPDQSRKKLPKISTIFFLFLSLTTRIILTVSHPLAMALALSTAEHQYQCVLFMSSGKANILPSFPL